MKPVEHCANQITIAPMIASIVTDLSVLMHVNNDTKAHTSLGIIVRSDLIIEKDIWRDKWMDRSKFTVSVTFPLGIRDIADWLNW